MHALKGRHGIRVARLVFFISKFNCLKFISWSSSYFNMNTDYSWIPPKQQNLALSAKFWYLKGLQLDIVLKRHQLCFPIYGFYFGQWHDCGTAATINTLEYDQNQQLSYSWLFENIPKNQHPANKNILQTV